MDERLITTLELGNGLTARMYDRSRKIAGDRWYVAVILRMHIPVNTETVDTSAVNASAEDVIGILGGEVIFETKMERNFIDDGDKGKIVDELVKSLGPDLSSYLSHRDFAKKFVAQSYRQAALQAKWYPSG